MADAALPGRATTMRAMVLHDWGQPLQLEEVPVPEPAQSEVLVKVKACGVGYTVSKILQGKTAREQPRKLPLIPGHEIAGEVVAVGARVVDIRLGTKVTAYFYLTCGKCRFCRGGADPLCTDFRGYVGAQIDGGYAEYVSLPADNVCMIPDEVYEDPAKASVIADAIATPLHVVRERARVRPMEEVLIVGAGGGVGIHVVQMAKLAGARVLAVDLGDAKVDGAVKVGADIGIDASREPFHKPVMAYTKNRGVDVVIDFVCTPETLKRGFECLATWGRLVMLAPLPDTQLELAARRFLSQEVSVTGSRYASRVELAEAVELVHRGAIEPIVSQVFPLEEAQRVHDLIDARQIVGRAALVL